MGYVCSCPIIKSRDIDHESPIFKPSCVLCNGEVINKGSNCIIYVTIKIAHCKNSSLCE